MTVGMKLYDLTTGPVWTRLGDAVTLTPGVIPPGPVNYVFPAIGLFPSLTLYPIAGPGLGIGE